MDDVNVIFGNVRKLLRWCHSTIIPSSILMCELSFMVFGHVCIIHCCVCVCVFARLNIIWDDKKIILHIMPAYNTTERMELAISRSKLNPWLKMIRITIFERANERVEMRIHLEPSWIYYSDSFYFILFFSRLLSFFWFHYLYLFMNFMMSDLRPFLKWDAEKRICRSMHTA